MAANANDALVYIVDDEFAVRDSLALLIESNGLRVKSFNSAEAFLNNFEQKTPACLILDVRMPLVSGLDLQEELVAKDIHLPIIFISGNANVPDSAKAFRAGAVHFLEKPFNHDVLLECVNEVINKEIIANQIQAEKDRISGQFDNLTKREQEVLRLIIAGYSNKEAAKKLGISYRTIEVHRARIMEKMQVENAVELAAVIMNNLH